MNISCIEDYKDILFRLLNIHHPFEKALQDDVINDEIRDFMVEDLSDTYETFSSLRRDIEKIVVPKNPFSNRFQLLSDKVVAFLYSKLMNFCETLKVKGITISKKFNENVSSILKNTQWIHHSHITGEIFGYSHTFCNVKVRENYYKIPVVAHNLFRFDFFFMIKGLRARVWKTRDIGIGGKAQQILIMPISVVKSNF